MLQNQSDESTVRFCLIASSSSGRRDPRTDAPKSIEKCLGQQEERISVNMAMRSVQTSRRGRPGQVERTPMSAGRKRGRPRREGDALLFARLKRVIRRAERRSGDGREI